MKNLISNDAWNNYKMDNKKSYTNEEIAYMLNNPEHMPEIFIKKMSVDAMKKIFTEDKINEIIGFKN